MDRKTTLPFLLLLAIGLSCPATIRAADPQKHLLAVAPAEFPDLFEWTDTCNVYVIRQGDAAILIDLGDADVLDHLQEIGVKKIEWVLFTSHHRELCQGYGRLKRSVEGSGAKIATNEGGRALFENPAAFRKIKPSLADPYTVHGASYVRPSIRPISIDRGFNNVDTFTWRGYEISCVRTHGNSPHAMSYLIRRGPALYAFSGDVMLGGARMYNWFDSEWDYSFGAGIYAMQEAVSILRGAEPDVMLPAHGAAISDPKAELAAYGEKLLNAETMILRTYRVVPYTPGDQDRISKPTAVPNVRRVSPHLFKFRGTNYIPNFSIIISDSGHGLVVDCGRVGYSLLDESLKLMRERLGLKYIDAVFITHMHGDHCDNAGHLHDKWGAKIWTLDSIVDKLERPERYDYAALIESYGEGIDSVHVDRAFKPGETLQWEGFTFTVDHMPGQTDFALALRGLIDGQKVVFTGDNIFGNPFDPKQNGHEAVVARNNAIPEEGYVVGADYLGKLQPDLIMGGHSWVMDHPAALIERYRKWSHALVDALHDLSGPGEYRYWFDPYWVSADPYRVHVKRGGSADVVIHVRNFRDGEQAHHLLLQAVDGLSIEPQALDGIVAGHSTGEYRVRLSAKADAPIGISIMAFDVALDSHRYGQLFDMIVDVE
ncbi:MAG TPA: MBL fold metallo-hydrolase [Tepidisphaeraceae bacterium]|jgi:glyoxylase-like metal-dependent hydrolase (beta-lactamase superfamily II)|nr:MBL fold metallo-hydrolase [Tepidisphaeraceae bacterium]